jgi:hypothetical protein
MFKTIVDIPDSDPNAFRLYLYTARQSVGGVEVKLHVCLYWHCMEASGQFYVTANLNIGKAVNSAV